MANPEKLATMGTKEAGRRQRKQKHNIDVCQLIKLMIQEMLISLTHQFYN